MLIGEVRAITARTNGWKLDRWRHSNYDSLVVATGATHSYFGHDEWAPGGAGLKTIEDALEIRRRVLIAYEVGRAGGRSGPAARGSTFAVVGGGPTGVELAGAIGEIARHALVRNFREKNSTRAARILLLEDLPRLLPPSPPLFATKPGDSSAKCGSRSGRTRW